MASDDAPTAGWRKFACDFKIIGEALQPFVIILGGIFAVGTYMVSEGHIREERTIELRRAYDEKQLDLYLEAARVAAHLAAVPANDPEHDALLARFWELYWGQLAFVESSDVETKMVQVCERYVSRDDTSRCHAGDDSTAGAAIALARVGSAEVKARWVK
jgi:hypothetical protein